MNLFFLCIKIFFIRILDVSLGTIRTIVTIKGKNIIAACIGFLEIFVWFVIAKEALDTDNNSIYIAISYSLGFATGTYLGGIISNKIIETNITVQIISPKSDELIDCFRKNNYGVTILDIEGKSNKKMLIIESTNKNLSNIRTITRNIDNKAFVFVNETKYVFNGYLGN